MEGWIMKGRIEAKKGGRKGWIDGRREMKKENRMDERKNEWILINILAMQMEGAKG